VFTVVIFTGISDNSLFSNLRLVQFHTGKSQSVRLVISVSDSHCNLGTISTLQNTTHSVACTLRHIHTTTLNTGAVGRTLVNSHGVEDNQSVSHALHQDVSISRTSQKVVTYHF
jgi:hypothetical protein